MFKRLRERITEEASKSVAQLGNNSIRSFSESDSKPVATNSSEDLITLSESSAVVVPHTSSQQFSIGEDEDGSMSEQSTPQRNVDISNGSASYSTPNVKEHSMGSDTSFTQEYRPKRLSYVPQSDIESEREDPPTLNLEGISKEQLLSVIDVLKARSYKYKNKYSEVVKNFKELRDEKMKIEKTLIDTQDKGSRRIAELREQCQLEQNAKAHLEDNLRLMLEEKDNRISVLETQINLLKDSKKADDSRSLIDPDSQSLELPNTDLLTGDSVSQCSSASQEKIERLEHQFSQAKKTITSQTDQISLLRKQNENLSQELEEKVKRVIELEDQQAVLKSEHESILMNMQIRLEELEKQQEESAMAMAETKRNMHEELELKEKQLVKAEKEASQYQSAVECEKQKVADLQKQYEDKINELQRQLESTEKTLEDEKQNLMQELARGKTAAITLMQKDCAQKISAIEEEWKLKLQDLQSQKSKSEIDEKHVNELKENLKQSDKQVQELNSLVIQLEKENVCLKNTNEKLKSEFDSRTAELETLQVKQSDLSYLREQESLSYEEKLKELNSKLKENNMQISSYQKTVRQYQEEIDQKQCIINTQKNCEKELKFKTDHLEKEVATMSSQLQVLNVIIEDMKTNNNLKLKEISELHECIKKLQSNESEATKDLLESKMEVDKLIKENKILDTKIVLLNSTISDLQKQLLDSEEQRHLHESIINEVKLEIQALCNCVTEKQELINKFQKNFASIETIITSLENEHLKLKSNVEFYEEILNKLLKKFSYVSASQQTLNNDIIADKNDSSGQGVLTTKNIQENKCRQDSVSQNKISKGENVEKKESLIEDLVTENAKLRRELHDVKELAEIQNVECAKNITELQKSLSDLCDERNNLSLVLQSIEVQSNEINSGALLKHKETLKDKISTENGQIVTNNVANINIMQLNNKVRTEIEALSSQTELINHELRFLQEQFSSSQSAFSEKIMHLNSKLLTRTEMLVRVKEGLDASLENADNLKTLLEDMKQQLNEKEDVLAVSNKEKKDLENKLKLLKEKHYKKELELKQSHNLQLSDLKNQTKATIDKLNEEIAKARNDLQDNERKYLSEISHIKEKCDNDMNKFLISLNEVFELKFIAEKLLSCNEEFESKVLKNFTHLDSYISKFDSVYSKFDKVMLKLKEKDKLIQDQLLQISELKNHVNDNDLLALKEKIVSLTSQLNLTKEELQTETIQRKHCENEISCLKEKYEATISEIKNILSTSEAERKLLESQIQEKQTELLTQKINNDELNSALSISSSKISESSTQISELQYHSENLKSQLENMSNALETQKMAVLLLESNKTSEYKEIYDTILSFANALSCTSFESLDKIVMALNTTDDRLKSFEMQLPKYNAIYNSLQNHNSQLLSKVQDWYLKMEKNLQLLKKISPSNNVAIEKTSGYQNDLNDIESLNICDNLESKFQILENQINSIIEAYLTLTEQVSVCEKFKHELEQKYADAQELHKCTKDQLEKSLSELKLKINDMIPSDKYNEFKHMCNLKIDDLSEVNEKLQNEINSLKARVEEKESVINDLEVKTVQMQSMISIEEFEVCKQECFLKTIEIKEKHNIEVREFENVIINLEKEIKELQQNVELKERLMEDQKFASSQMVSQEDFENYKLKYEENINELTDKYNIEVKELKAIIEKLKNDVSNLQANLEAKETQIKDLEAKTDQMSSMITEEEFEEYKNKCNAKAMELNDNYNIEIGKLKDIIINLENKIVNERTNLEEKENLIKDLETKIVQMSSMISAEKFEEYKLKCSVKFDELNNKFTIEIKELKDVILNLENEISSLQANIESKDKVLKDLKNKVIFIISVISSDVNYKCEDLNDVLTCLQENVSKLFKSFKDEEKEIQRIQEQQANSEILHKENLESLKNKYDSAEKNYISQLEEMKQNIIALKNEKFHLEENNLKLIKANEEILEKKSQQIIQEEQKKEYLEKIQNLQQKLKDKEVLASKLESVISENSEKIESLKKKIKSLEQEREQLMYEAQERVSATEAKCREDISLLQKENNKLSTVNKELEQLKNKLCILEKEKQENLLTIETSKSKYNEEILHLKEQFEELREEFHTVETDKQLTINKLQEQLQKFKEESSHLVSKSVHLEDLKSEKEALNEKLKQAELQISFVKKLESERDSLKLENASILEQLELLKSSQGDSKSLLLKIKSLEETIETSQDTMLVAKNEKLKSELSELKDAFITEINSLKVRNEYLSKQINLLEKIDASDPNSMSVKKYIEAVRQECEDALKEKEEDFLKKYEILMRDHAQEMVRKEREYDKVSREILERNQEIEARLIKEHKDEIAELRQNLFEKECALDDIRDDYEERLQEKDKKIKEYELMMKSSPQSGNGISPDSALLTTESSDWDDTRAVPDETIESNASPIHVNAMCEGHVQQIETLKEELSKSNSEIKELKVLLRLSPPESMDEKMNNNNRRDSLQSLPEPTEFEYLKNIIYEYMMGKEPVTLVKVIAAVLRFSEAQTQQVIRKEESRHQTANHWLGS